MLEAGYAEDAGNKSTLAKKQAALAEYTERLAQHKRAKSEFEATVNVVTSSLYGIVDPGSWKMLQTGCLSMRPRKGCGRSQNSSTA